MGILLTNYLPLMPSCWSREWNEQEWLLSLLRGKKVSSFTMFLQQEQKFMQHFRCTGTEALAALPLSVVVSDFLILNNKPTLAKRILIACHQSILTITMSCRSVAEEQQQICCRLELRLP